MLRAIALICTATSVVAFGCSHLVHVQCESDANCDLGGGGVCTLNDTGNRWCAYPDSECSSGYRYSDFDVGDGVGGACVIPPVSDAGPDAGPDAGGPTIDWVTRRGAGGDDAGDGVAIAPNGDAVMTGTFAGTITLGGDQHGARRRMGGALSARWQSCMVRKTR